MQIEMERRRQRRRRLKPGTVRIFFDFLNCAAADRDQGCLHGNADMSTGQPQETGDPPTQTRDESHDGRGARQSNLNTPGRIYRLMRSLSSVNQLPDPFVQPRGRETEPCDQT